MISLQQKVTISPEVMSQEVGGETVLLDMKSEHYFGLDETGTRIWQLLMESKDLQSVFDTMLDEYEVSETELERDFQEYLKKLVGAGVISLT